jgi:hypothetical protein
VLSWFGQAWQSAIPYVRPNNFSSINMSMERERRAALGIGFGNNTMPMPNTPKTRMPELLLHRREIRTFVPARGAVFKAVQPDILRMLEEPDGLTSAALAEAAALSVNEARSRISQYRRMLRNSKEPDVHRTSHRGHAGVHYFKTAEQLAAWYGRQSW